VNFGALSIGAGTFSIQALKKAAFEGAWRAFGQDCVLCGGRARGSLVCDPCLGDLPWLGERAPDGAIAAFEYRFPVDRLVRRFKFAGDLAIGHWLGEQLAGRVRGPDAPDLLVAPPLSPRALRERGFNQAMELARSVGRALEVRVEIAALRKVRETAPQRTLGRRQRQSNLRGAFACELDLRGADVAIVDDVITTGATARSVAAALRRAGARSVRVWAAARAP
jgi:ComF family protein